MPKLRTTLQDSDEAEWNGIMVLRVSSDDEPFLEARTRCVVRLVAEEKVGKGKGKVIRA